MAAVTTATVDSNAKINLTLDIVGKRPDGYHEVSMIMQSLALADTLTLRRIAGAGIIVQANIAGVVRSEDNLAYRAAKALADDFAIADGMIIKIVKRIPVAAGLAGGSGNAAAALRAVNELFELGLSDEQLCDYGAKIGSDVPFCLMGGTMQATGRGEVLRRLPPLPRCYVVLVKLPVSVSTAWAYQNYRAEAVERRPDTAAAVDALATGDLTKIAKCLCNVLESVTIKRYPEINAIKTLMIKYGALASLMSGSGPTVFALTDDQQRAQYLQARLSENLSAQVLLTHTI